MKGFEEISASELQVVNGGDGSVDFFYEAGHAIGSAIRSVIIALTPKPTTAAPAKVDSAYKPAGNAA